MTFEEAAARFQQLASRLRPTTVGVIRAGIDGTRTKLQDAYGRSAIGRAIWSKTGDTPNVAVKNTSDGADVEVTGLAALIEDGGRTAAHDIEPLGKALAGGLLHPVTETIRHPGSRVERNPQLAGAAQDLDRQLARDGDAAVQTQINALGLN